MSGRFFLSGTIPLFEGAAQPLSTLTFSLTGTATAQDTYSDAGLTSANTNPVVSDANGYFGEIFIKRERYKVIWKNAAGTTLKTWDPVDKDQVFTRGAGLPSDPHPGQKHANTSDGHTYEYKLDTAAWLDLGTTDSVGNTASVTQQLTGTSASVYSTPDSVAGLWQRGADIASAATLSLPAGGGGWFNVTGTTPVTGISSAQGGRKVSLKFAAGCQLTHNGTSFILIDGVNETTYAGAIYEFVNDAAQDASGSNWRCVSRVLPNSNAAAAKTTNYTVLDTDRNAVLRFSGLSGNATLTLPAAANRAGFRVSIVNEDTSDFAVVIDPNSAELIDGFSSRSMWAASRVTIICDGTGWRTEAGNYSYSSGNQTITASGALTLAHGLGVRPTKIWTEIQCTSTEGNYSVGDRVTVGHATTDSATYRGVNVASDATNLTVLFATAASTFHVPNKTTRANFPITNANWRLRVYAEE